MSGSLSTSSVSGTLAPGARTDDTVVIAVAVAVPLVVLAGIGVAIAIKVITARNIASTTQTMNDSLRNADMSEIQYAKMHDEQLTNNQRTTERLLVCEN